MKVLYITNSPSPYRIDFFNELGKLCDLDVTFELNPADNKHRNAQWYNLDFKNFNAIQLHKTHIFGKYICFDVLKVLKKKYDVIVIGVYSTLTSMLAMSYMQRHKIKFFINSDGGFIKQDENCIQKAIKEHLMKKASYYLVSGDMTGRYCQYYGGKEKRYFKYAFSTYRKEDLPKSVISIEEKKVIREKLGIDTDAIVFLSVGQFIYRKGYDILIKACMNLPPEAQIYIVGDNPTDEYKRLIENNNVSNVYFPGFKSKCDLMEYYKAADVFVLPTREDIWGLVVVEAMNIGLPVITTDRCLAGVELINDGKNGFVVQAENIELLHDCMVKNCTDTDMIREMGTVAFESMQNYTIEECALEHHKAFKWVCEENNVQGI